MNRSLADDFISVMADLRAIDPDNDEPMRYAMRSIKNEAEQVIANALRTAHALAYQARSLQRDAAEAAKDAVEAATKTETKETT